MQSLKFVFCCYKRITLASSVQTNLNKSCLSIHNILFDLLLIVVQVSRTLINIKPKLWFINMINMSYCGNSHWNRAKSSLLTNSCFLKNGSADFSQNFTNERRNPTKCYYEIFFFIFMN